MQQNGVLWVSRCGWVAGLGPALAECAKDTLHAVLQLFIRLAPLMATSVP